MIESAVMIRELVSLPDIHALTRLLGGIWGAPDATPISEGLLRALSHSGNYLAGCYLGSDLVGGLVGFFGQTQGRGVHLHSHILGVLRGARMVEIKTDAAPSSPSPISQAVRAGDFLFVSGQTPRRASGEAVEGDFAEEVRAVLDNVKAIVTAGGGTLSQICKVNAYITDPSLFDSFNAIYREYFDQTPLPARTTVACALARPGIRVEVEAVAWLG